MSKLREWFRDIDGLEFSIIGAMAFCGFLELAIIASAVVINPATGSLIPRAPLIIKSGAEVFLK